MTSDQRLAQATQGVFIFKLFMGAITGTSLLVGGPRRRGVGLVFATYPARRAGRLTPIDAVRRE